MVKDEYDYQIIIKINEKNNNKVTMSLNQISC